VDSTGILRRYSRAMAAPFLIDLVSLLAHAVLIGETWKSTAARVSSCSTR
jgi:hypothetical protein